MRSMQTCVLLATLALLTGCPAGQSTNQGAAKPPTTKIQPGKSVAPQPRAVPLELNGIRLETPYEEIKKRIEAGGSPKVVGDWKTPGIEGVLHVTPQNGALQPADDYYFADGKLVGFFKRFLQDDGGYVKNVENLALNFDPGAITPPTWAANDAFVKAMPVYQPPDGQLFWQDEARKELMITQRQNASNRAIACLFKPEPCERIGLSYDKLLEALADKPTSPAAKSSALTN